MPEGIATRLISRIQVDRLSRVSVGLGLLGTNDGEATTRFAVFGLPLLIDRVARSR